MQKKGFFVVFFQIAYDIARYTKDAFNQQALPKFFQCAPAIGINYDEESGAKSSEVNQLILYKYTIYKRMREIIREDKQRGLCIKKKKRNAVLKINLRSRFKLLSVTWFVIVINYSLCNLVE